MSCRSELISTYVVLPAGGGVGTTVGGTTGVVGTSVSQGTSMVEYSTEVRTVV